MAGAICATVLGASLQGARICRRRDEVCFLGRLDDFDQTNTVGVVNQKEIGGGKQKS